MGFQPRLAFFFGCVVPRVAGLRGISGEVTPEGVHSNHPEMLVVSEAAFPAGSGPAVEISVREGGAITDRALRGDGCPGLRPAGLVAAWGAWAAVGQVGLDEGSGGTGLLRAAATRAHAITTDAVGRPIQWDDVAGEINGDSGVGHKGPPYRGIEGR
jgi:hypothetical protein